MHPVSIAEIEKLARNHGAYIEAVSKSKDQLGRKIHHMGSNNYSFNG